MRRIRTILCSNALVGTAGLAAAQAPLGTAFTYQGQLKENQSPAGGTYDLRFRLFDAAVGGAQIGTDCVDGVMPDDGLFTVELDFGLAVFDGNARWLEIAVRSDATSANCAGGAAYTVLNTRQPLTAVPYALFALDGPGQPGFWAANGTLIHNTNSGFVGIGTSSPQSNLHVAGGTGALRLDANDSAGSYFLLDDRSPTQAKISKFNGAGGCVLDLNPMAVDGVSGAVVRFFRETNTTGAKQVEFLRGNNTVNQLSAVIGVDGADSWFQLHGGNVGIGTANPTRKLDVVSTEAGVGAIYALASPASGPANAIFAQTDSTIGSGVVGRSTATTGTGTGVFGETSSPGGLGVWGVSLASTGATTGVAGLTISPQGRAVYGVGGPGTGVLGEASTGTGVVGVSESGTGVRGYCTSASGYGGSFGDIFGPGKGILVAGESHLLSPVGIGTISTAGQLHVRGNATTLALEGTDHSYIEWYPDGYAAGRKGWMGYGNANDNDFTIRNQISGANIDLVTTGGGAVRVPVLEITGADVAEKFPTSDERESVKPGMVMEIDPNNAGKLRIAHGAYNCRVAGVVSGAGDIPVGAILGNLPGHEDAPAIALSGRVWVHCDAGAAPIAPGDLLTTSETPGHAMKAADRSRAHGAIIGKAMTSLDSGSGLVLVLVNLQ